MSTINFNQTEEKSLWKISDVADGKEYSWPIWVARGTFSGDAAFLVWPAVPVSTNAQQDFIYNRLRNASFFHRPPKYVIRTTRLEDIASKINEPGEPGSHVKWPDELAPIQELESSPDTEFVHHVCNALGYADYKTARFLYTAFCHHAVKWMLEQNKPLNLGFATVRAFPFRENWKAIMHAKYPELWKAFKNSGEELESELRRWGVDVAMVSEDMLAATKDGTFQWSLDITPSSEFIKLTEKAELDCLASSPTKTAYLFRLRNLMEKCYEHAIDSLRSFIKKASEPMGSVDKGRIQDNMRLVPRFTRGRVRPGATPPPVTRYQTDSNAPQHEPIAKSNPDASPFEDLQDLPDGKLSIGFSAGRRKPDLR